MKTINTLTADFKNALYELINKSDLPVVNVLMVINEIQQSINYTYLKVLEKEKQEEQEE